MLQRSYFLSPASARSFSDFVNMLLLLYLLLICAPVISCVQHSNDSSSLLKALTNSSTVSQWLGITTEILRNTTTYRFDSYSDHLITIAETDVLFRVISVQDMNGLPSRTSYFTSNYRVPDAAQSSREALDPGAISTLSDTCKSAAIAYSANISNIAGTYTPPAGCCSALSPCFLSAGDVRVFYWPNATANSSQSITEAPRIMTMVSEGYTYTSPSVYVIYSNISADQGTAYECYGIGTTSLNPGVGPTISQTIQAYPPGELSTGHCYNGLARQGIFDPANLETPLPNSVVTTMSGCVSVAQYNLEGSGTELWANPQLLVNKYLSRMDPAWSTCHLFWEGLHDPPIALTSAAELLIDPVTTKSGGSVYSPVAPEPLPMISIPTITSTTTHVSDVLRSPLRPSLPLISPTKRLPVDTTSPQVSADPSGSPNYGPKEPTNSFQGAVKPSETAIATEFSIGQEPIRSGFVVVSFASSLDTLATLFASVDQPVQDGKSGSLLAFETVSHTVAQTAFRDTAFSFDMAHFVDNSRSNMLAEGTYSLPLSLSTTNDLTRPNTDVGDIPVATSTIDPDPQAAVVVNNVVVDTSTVSTEEHTFTFSSQAGKTSIPPAFPGDPEHQKISQGDVSVAVPTTAQGSEHTFQQMSVSRGVSIMAIESYISNNPHSVGVSAPISTLPSVIDQRPRPLPGNIYTTSGDLTLNPSHQTTMEGVPLSPRPESVTFGLLVHPSTSPYSLPRSAEQASHIREIGSLTQEITTTSSSMTISAIDSPASLSDTATSILLNSGEYPANDPYQDSTTEPASAQPWVSVHGHVPTAGSGSFSAYTSNSQEATPSENVVSLGVISQENSSSTATSNPTSVAGLGGIIASAFGAKPSTASVPNKEPSLSMAADMIRVEMGVVGLVCLSVCVLTGML